MICDASKRFAKKGKVTLKQQIENEILQKVKQERESLRDKQGIEHYFKPDLTNSIDREIVKRIKDNGASPIAEERRCKIILASD
jgi:hypothetical protein